VWQRRLLIAARLALGSAFALAAPFLLSAVCRYEGRRFPAILLSSCSTLGRTVDLDCQMFFGAMVLAAMFLAAIRFTSASSGPCPSRMRQFVHPPDCPTVA